MLTVLWIAILAISIVYFFRDNFVSELIVSFLPYIIWFCVFAFVLEIYLIIRQSKKNTTYKLLKIILTIIITILTIWVWTLYSLEYFWFYNQNDESIRLTEENWIKVFYANIYYKNDNYTSLREKIEQENPDIVILVEFSDDHEKAMKELFRKKYPYMNRNSRSTMLAGDVVFSKIPLKNITETHIAKPWDRNYSYMKLLCDECKDWVDLYVIHTAAPVSPENYNMRNNQIWRLLSNFIKYHTSWTPTMIIWDFNLSPWSYYYKQLNKHRDMLNALSFQSPNHTRSLFEHWIFRSHIDQLFISPEIRISNIDIENLTWSDHRSFTFRFWTKD